MPWIADDLTDRTFGSLTVLKRGPNTGRRRVRWYCRCRCGKEILASASDLRSGHTISCGCSRIPDLTDQSFGKLMVLRLAFTRNRQAYWLCRCECGKETTVRRTNLLNGNTKSCGSHEVRLPANSSKEKGETRPRFRNLTGQRFGKLAVTGRAPNAGRRTCWFCDCDCGTKTKSIWAEKLMVGKTVSCGCHRAVDIGNRRRTHGRTLTREYRVWSNMRRRCQDPNNPAYPRYGGRGIEVAPEFQTFEGFLAYMGPSNGLTLDRINNHGDYAPGNVRWTDVTTQGRNKRNNWNIAFNGKTQPLSAWAEQLGIATATLRERLGCWPLEKALTASKGSRVPNVKNETLSKPQARRMLKIALASGKLIAQPCEVCGHPETDGHHWDYSRPLDVRWLCRKHHAKVHRKHPL